MRKRIVTYDVKDGNDYDKFYELVDQYNAQELTKSTYEFDTNLSQEQFERLIANAFSRGDKVYFISSNDKGIFSKRIV